MAESTTIATLRHKRDETARSIVAYEKRLEQARADLAHINAAITILSASGERQVLPPYVDVHRLFARGEAMTLCKAALASGPMNTRQLALHVMKAKVRIPTIATTYSDPSRPPITIDRDQRGRG